MLSGSAGATLATAPFTAAALGTVALAGLGLNLVAIPLAALVVPAVVASLAIGLLLPMPAAPLAAGAGVGLGLLQELARWGAAIPGGHLVLPATVGLGGARGRSCWSRPSGAYAARRRTEARAATGVALDRGGLGLAAGRGRFGARCPP